MEEEGKIQATAKNKEFFLDQMPRLRPVLIKRTSGPVVKGLLDQLQAHRPPVLIPEEAGEILHKSSVEDQVRSLVDVVIKKGDKACGLLLSSLREVDNYLYRSLDLAADTDTGKDVTETPLLKQTLQSIFRKRFQLVSQEMQPGIKKHLLDIFTDLCIIEGPGGVNDEHELSAMRVRLDETRTTSGNMKTVQLSDLFSDHYHTGEPVKKVLTLGIAGVGKTVAVKKFVLDWAEDTQSQNIRLVFVLPFRELNMLPPDKDYSLVDLLQKFYPDCEELAKAFGNKKDLILFVLDGLDESRLELFKNSINNDPNQNAPVSDLITSLIKGTLLPSALIWVTSRPAAASTTLQDLFDLVTEIQGFSERQREEYFRRVIPETAEDVIAHLKSKRSLYIMCHIPVFCHITAVVLGGNQREQDISMRSDQEKTSTRTGTLSLTRTGTLGHQKRPKTLTEMYARYCVLQLTRSNEKKSLEEETKKDSKICAKDTGNILIKLGKLAFKYLEQDTLIFYEKDLRECDIDGKSEAMQAGLCRQIFKEDECGKGMFSFVHLSVQEFLAALYMLHMHATSQTNLFTTTPLQKTKWFFNKSRFNLYKDCLEKSFSSQNGHLDLFVRFLLGLAPMLVTKIRNPLKEILPHLSENAKEMSISKTVDYIKRQITQNSSPERIINLFHCLSELGDNSLVEEIDRYMSSSAEKNLTPAQCSAWAYLLLMSADILEEFDLKKYLRSQEGLHRMLPVVSISKRVQLNQCHLSKACCSMLASALQGPHSNLQELDISENDLQDKGIELLLREGLITPQCQLRTLRLANCKLTARSCEIVTSVLQSPNPLTEMDLSNNNLGDSGIQLLSKGLSSSDCRLEILRLSGCLISEEGCEYLVAALTSNPSHLEELDLSYNHPGESGLNLLSARQEDPDCKLKTLITNHCGAVRLYPMTRYVCDVTLDPNSACRYLSLSEGNRKVTYVRELQPYPDHPDRFDFWEQVLCTEGLSGRCYWEAEWSGHKAAIAVAYKGIERKGGADNVVMGLNAKSWSLSCSTNGYSVSHNNRHTDIPAPSSRSRRVGVYLDWPAGTLSFYSVSYDTVTHLYTFRSTFTEPLYPGFVVSDSSVSLCQAI